MLHFAYLPTVSRSLQIVVVLMFALAVAGAPNLAAAQNEDDATEPGSATTWSISPAFDDEDDDAEPRVSLRMEVEPGESATDAITVTNFSDRTVAFEVYASDGIITDDGLFDVLPSATAPTAAGAWVSIGDGDDGEPRESVTVEIEPESDVRLPVEITVPEDATPGDHPAGIVAALAGGDGGVGMESRVGTRIHLRVAGELAPTVLVDDIQTRYEFSWNPFSAGTLHVDYRLVNDGNIRLGADAAAAGTSLFGLSERDGPGDEHREILPGDDATGSIELENVWPLLRMSGDVSAVPVVVGDDVIDVALEDASTAFTAWTVPWLHLLVLAAIILALFGRRQLRQRREAEMQARIAAAVDEAVQDDRDREAPRPAVGR